MSHCRAARQILSLKAVPGFMTWRKNLYKIDYLRHFLLPSFVERERFSFDKNKWLSRFWGERDVASKQQKSFIRLLQRLTRLGTPWRSLIPRCSDIWSNDIWARKFRAIISLVGLNTTRCYSTTHYRMNTAGRQYTFCHVTCWSIPGLFISLFSSFQYSWQ